MAAVVLRWIMVHQLQPISTTWSTSSRSQWVSIIMGHVLQCRVVLVWSSACWSRYRYTCIVCRLFHPREQVGRLPVFAGEASPTVGADWGTTLAASSPILCNLRRVATIATTTRSIPLKVSMGDIVHDVPLFFFPPAMPRQPSKRHRIQFKMIFLRLICISKFSQGFL